MTDHKHLVNMTEIRQTPSGCTVLRDDYYKNEMVYYLIHDGDWDGERYNGTLCDIEGNCIGNPRHDGTPIYPVDNWDDGGNFDRIGYSSFYPDYPQASLDLIP